MITDTHAHLDYSDYDADRDLVVQRAREMGVTGILTIGIGRESIPKSLALAEQYPDVYAAVGVHPTAMDDLRPDEWNLLETAARHPRVVAIGETGLDNHHLPKENVEEHQTQQKDYFLRQLELAKKSDKPVIIHCREAYEETLLILKDFGRFRNEPGVMHCFGADMATAEKVFDLGYVISVGGILTFKNADALRDVVRQMPRDKLLLETDCPYLAPIPHRGKRNEPGYTRFVAEKLAELWNLPLEDTTDLIAQNVKRVFGI